MEEKLRGSEAILDIQVKDLRPFPNHPFQVRDDDSMKETVESVKENGVLVPVIVWEKDGGYEIISGHRRKRACELAGMETIPAIVRNLDDDTAIIHMVDSNVQRETVLPSEKAKAYKMKLDAIKRRAGRPAKENSDQFGQNLNGKTSREMIAENSPDSSTQIQRYIRLTELEPELMQMVDEKKIAMTPAVELSYLKPEEQRMLLETIESEQSTPSLSQAQRMKKMSQSGELNIDSILSVMMEQKKPEKLTLTLDGDKLPDGGISVYSSPVHTPHRRWRRSSTVCLTAGTRKRCAPSRGNTQLNTTKAVVHFAFART